MNVENAQLRYFLYALYRTYSRSFIFYQPPRVLVNSIPKAGTHLVSKVLSLAPQFKFFGLHIENRKFLTDMGTAQKGERPPEFDYPLLERAISKVPNGQFITGHLPFQEEMSGLFSENKYKVIMLLRDPRDIVVSHAKYIVRLQRHLLHNRYVNEFKNDDERLMASICGLVSDSNELSLVNIGTRLERFMGWVSSPDVLVCRFEHLIGSNGGSSRELQLAEIESILNFINRPLNSIQVEALADKVWSPNSATFRKGKINDWKNHFKEEHKIAFKELAGDNLVAMGYANDHSW